MGIEELIFETNMEFAEETIAVLREHVDRKDELINAFIQISNAYTKSAKKIVKISAKYVYGELSSSEEE